MSKESLPAENNYACRLRGHKMLATKDDKPYIEISFVVLDGPGGAESRITGTLTKYFTGDAMKYTAAALRHLGFQGKSFRELDPRSPHAHSFKGVEVILNLRHEEYKGKWRAKWDVPFQAEEKRIPESKWAWLDEMDQKFLGAEEQAEEE